MQPIPRVGKFLADHALFEARAYTPSDPRHKSPKYLVRIRMTAEPEAKPVLDSLAFTLLGKGIEAEVWTAANKPMVGLTVAKPASVVRLADLLINSEGLASHPRAELMVAWEACVDLMVPRIRPRLNGGRYRSHEFSDQRRAAVANLSRLKSANIPLPVALDTDAKGR